MIPIQWEYWEHNILGQTLGVISATILLGEAKVVCNRVLNPFPPYAIPEKDIPYVWLQATSSMYFHLEREYFKTIK